MSKAHGSLMEARGSFVKSLVRTLLPRRAGAHRILSGPLRGFRIVTSWHDYPAAILGTTETALVKWFAANVRPGDTWLDVGAHYGYTALALCRQVGINGRVFAFEPVLSTAAYLEGTRKSNRLQQLTIVPVALGANGSLTVATSSVDRGMATHSESAEMTTNLCVVGLDRLWPGISGGQPRIDGIKIDVQGMEHETVRGMLSLLGQWHPKVIIEFHTGVNRDPLVHDLADVGYRSAGRAIELDEAESDHYLDDRSYLFLPAAAGHS
jgi:FkbM family methyltransferase